MADVLILSDLLVPDLEENKRGTTESILYRTIQKQNIALGATPYATLLGPAILGSSLERAGHSVRILECAFRAPQRLNLIVELKKNIAIFFSVRPLSSLSPSLTNVFLLCEN